MGQKGYIMVQKGLKMYKKKAKNGVFGPKIPAFYMISFKTTRVTQSRCIKKARRILFFAIYPFL